MRDQNLLKSSSKSSFLFTIFAALSNTCPNLKEAHTIYQDHDPTAKTVRKT